MYKKGSKGWLKHFDFILLDMICLQIAFLLAYVIRHDSGSSNLFLNGSLFTHFSSLVLKYDLPHIYIKGGIFPINLMTQGGLYDYVKSILYL